MLALLGWSRLLLYAAWIAAIYSSVCCLLFCRSRDSAFAYGSAGCGWHSLLEWFCLFGFLYWSGLLCCCHMQLEVLFDCICNWRFAGICPWPAGSLQIACDVLITLLGLVLLFAPVCLSSLLVVAGLCVHIKLIQLWVLVTLQFSFGCPFLGLLWRLLPLCSLCWCSGSHQFGWGSLPNCLGYWCRVLCRNSASMLVRLKDIEGSFMLQLTSMC